jgi:hypothetical protein
MKENKVLNHKQLRAAKRAFPRKPHTTRPFTSDDYKALPKQYEARPA